MATLNLSTARPSRHRPASARGNSRATKGRSSPGSGEENPRAVSQPGPIRVAAGGESDCPGDDEDDRGADRRGEVWDSHQPRRPWPGSP